MNENEIKSKSSLGIAALTLGIISVNTSLWLSSRLIISTLLLNTFSKQIGDTLIEQFKKNEELLNIIQITDFLYINKQVLFYQFDKEPFHHSPVEEIKYSEIDTILNGC